MKNILCYSTWNKEHSRRSLIKIVYKLDFRHTAWLLCAAVYIQICVCCLICAPSYYTIYKKRNYKKTTDILSLGNGLVLSEARNEIMSCTYGIIIENNEILAISISMITCSLYRTVSPRYTLCRIHYNNNSWVSWAQQEKQWDIPCHWRWLDFRLTNPALFFWQLHRDLRWWQFASVEPWRSKRYMQNMGPIWP